MRGTKLHNAAIGLLTLALAASFLWCVVDNVMTSAAMAEAGVTVAVNSRTVASGVMWLIGHGIHGAAVVAAPLVLVRRSAANMDNKTVGREL